MAEGLLPAQNLAELVRFSGDTLRRSTTGDSRKERVLRSQLLRNGFQITPEVTPALAARLDELYTKLQMPADAVLAFVEPSPEIQADCFAGSAFECIVRFSSALVDLLDDDEFGFVAGHEIGHFLLGHGVARSEVRGESLEYFMQERSQELSSDRIGLLACGSLDVAVRALMKTASGLTRQHLRFDVGTFISQLQKSVEFSQLEDPTLSHPSMIIRCRALLWFSLSDFYISGTKDFTEAQMQELDSRIQSDLEKFVNGPARERIQRIKDELSMWIAVCGAVGKGRFEKTDQSIIAEIFGRKTLEKLKNFLRDIPAPEVQQIVYEKMKSARDELEGVIPSSFEAEYQQITNQIAARFKAD